MIKQVLLLIFLLGIITQGFGQITVSGTVTDAADGTSLPGVTVRIKDTNQGTQTNMEGRYELTTTEDAVLVFSFIGMASHEEAVDGRSVVNVTLQSDITNLEEVVFIGYGTGTRQDLTAPITTVRSEEIARQITANPAQALQGKVAGMQVTNSGEPGSQPQIRIRGVSTAFGEGGGPLYVVDGVIVSNINFLNNNDIESITILKDASAGAIYGVQAANGVILVETKEGKEGATQINFSSYTGFQQATNVLEMANTSQYLELLNQRTGLTGSGDFYDPANFPNSTNWYNELTRQALITSHEISISGGTKNSSYSYGVGYYYQDGILNTSNTDNRNNFNRLNFRVKNDYYFDNSVDIGYNLIFSKNNSTPANNYALYQAYVAPPAFEARDENGDWTDPTALGFSGPFANPMATVYYHNVMNDEYTVIPSTYLSFDFLKDFHFRSSLSADLSFDQNQGYNPTFYVSGLQQNTTSSINKTRDFRRNLQFDNTLEYRRFFNMHSLKIMAGSSVQELFSNYLYGVGYNVPDVSDATQYISVGDVQGPSNDGGFKSRVLSFFSRLSYNYDSKYLLTATVRADGSSRYNEPWGIFPSLGLGWVLTQEDFLSNQNLFSYLKLRGSWGQLGNNNVTASSSVIVGGPGPGTTGIFGGNNPIPGLTFQTVYNNFLVWETIEEFNVGFEMFSLADRLNLEVDFYNRITNNAAFPAPVAGVSGTGLPMGFYWSASLLLY